ncbi:hypothetical protein [Bradyrhizobium sp. RDI18]|uniref:hypothetical protein n=1 Tax=Bradyrhizobium sp. RDI18 TaxID=3367400 RepID=UPI00371D933F
MALCLNESFKRLCFRLAVTGWMSRTRFTKADVKRAARGVLDGEGKVAREDPRAGKPRQRVRRHGLFMLDVEIIEELGLPEKLGRNVLRQLDKPLPGRRRFPQPVSLCGDRRFWPAVYRYFMEEFGGLPSSNITPIAPAITWEENFDETPQARRPGNTRPRLAAAKQAPRQEDDKATN